MRNRRWRWLREAHAPTLVHGHTHAPASHTLAPGVTRHVLSDWELDGSSAPRAEVMRWTAAGFERIAPRPAPPSIRHRCRDAGGGSAGAKRERSSAVRFPKRSGS